MYSTVIATYLLYDFSVYLAASPNLPSLSAYPSSSWSAPLCFYVKSINEKQYLSNPGHANKDVYF